MVSVQHKMPGLEVLDYSGFTASASGCSLVQYPAWAILTHYEVHRVVCLKYDYCIATAGGSPAQD